MLSYFTNLKAETEDLVMFITQTRTVWIKERAARNNGPWEGQHPIREAIREVEDLYNYLNMAPATPIELMTVVAMIGAQLIAVNKQLTAAMGEEAMKTYKLVDR